MVQGTRRYDRLAEQYSQYRPRYPDQLLSHLADIIAKTEALDTTTAQGRLVFHMFGALVSGIRAQLDPRAHPSGSCCCSARRPDRRPSTKTHRRRHRGCQGDLANPDIGVTQIAHRLGVSPATLYRYTPAARTANTPSVWQRPLYPEDRALQGGVSAWRRAAAVRQ
jgi:hypothetical protein